MCGDQKILEVYKRRRVIKSLAWAAAVYTNSYYYIGHFSKFVRPGAKRIASSPSRSQLLSTAFINPDGKVSVVVMNKSDQKISYYLWLAGNAAEVSSLPHFYSDARVLTCPNNSS